MSDETLPSDEDLLRHLARAGISPFESAALAVRVGIGIRRSFAETGHAKAKPRVDQRDWYEFELDRP